MSPYNPENIYLFALAIFAIESVRITFQPWAKIFFIKLKQFFLKIELYRVLTDLRKRRSIV